MKPTVLSTWARGLPRLQHGGSALAATIILGVIHAFWHLPAFFYRDAYRSMGLAAGLPMLVLSVVAAAVTFTWIYNSTRGSILAVALYHALFDWLSVSKAGGAMAPAVMSGWYGCWLSSSWWCTKPPTWHGWKSRSPDTPSSRSY